MVSTRIHAKWVVLSLGQLSAGSLSPVASLSGRVKLPCQVISHWLFVIEIDSSHDYVATHLLKRQQQEDHSLHHIASYLKTAGSSLSSAEAVSVHTEPFSSLIDRSYYVAFALFIITLMLSEGGFVFEQDLVYSCLLVEHFEFLDTLRGTKPLKSAAAVCRLGRHNWRWTYRSDELSGG